MSVEIKTLNVPNSREDSTISEYLDFGWTLKSSQRIYNKDSHLESRGEDIYSVTETTDFTKLVFERNSNMPNYSILSNLERKHSIIKDSLPKDKPQCPRDIGSITDFAKYNEKKLHLTLITKEAFALIGAILLQIVISINDILLNLAQGISLEAMLKYILTYLPGTILVFLGISYAISIPIVNFFKKRAFQIAINSPDSAPGKRLAEKYAQEKAEYERALKVYDDYLDMYHNMNELRHKARQYLK